MYGLKDYIISYMCVSSAWLEPLDNIIQKSEAIKFEIRLLIEEVVDDDIFLSTVYNFEKELKKVSYSEIIAIIYNSPYYYDFIQDLLPTHQYIDGLNLLIFTKDYEEDPYQMALPLEVV